MSVKRLAPNRPLFSTPPLDIIDSPADALHAGGDRAMPPQFIYLHATGGVNSLAWLSKTSQPPVSSHRLISKLGTVYKLVDDHREAYTQGYGVMGRHIPHGLVTCNTDGLSIELENLDVVTDTYPVVQVIKCAMQVWEWWGKYGLLPVLSHYDVDTRKVDPAFFPWAVFWDNLYRLMRGADPSVLLLTYGNQ